ncbi:TonB-dependent hemoglobin/transferrin/lactoferrin family receptor [Rhizobium sp. CECT 9324]|uniref:TonB-dependent hemoglobin/transferrin/lactoferrin family receptor n=1 Tax=Rhizobium sp. CECT 9324 TaxID=2845820 RepID=UPI001E4B566A|nr:TonB-dependent hemoglobin/transferrin/lactoferrin family receptor [Rhizobium sp. CECT 9324]CAH0341486.1 Vitamin B12 transporter BtuB [Rhizobium sp. CECT 9324]
MGSRSFRPTLLACTALALIAISNSAFSQEVADSAAANGDTQLNTIVVKGKRVATGTVISNSPQVSQRTAEDLRRNQINSFRDLGRSLEPGVDFVKSEGGVTIRGLGGPRVLTTIDGIPLPYLDNFARRGGPATTTNVAGGSDSFDFSSISTLDVLRGSDSSRLGSGALAGGIALRTLEPEDLIGEGRDWGGMAKASFDSEDMSFGGSAAVAKRIDDTSVLFQGTYRRGQERQNQGSVDTIGATRTEANPGDFNQNNLLFKLRQELEGGHTVGLTAERYRYNSDTELKTLTGATTGSSRIWAVGEYDGFDDTARDRVSLDYSFLNPAEDAVIQSARLSVYWQDTTKNAGATGRRVGAVAGPWLRDNELQESAIGFTGNVVSEFDTGNLTHELTIGADGALLDTSQFVAGIDACTLGTVTAGCTSLKSNQSDMPDIDGKKFGIYIDDKISMENSAFSITPGIRFDWYDYDPKLTDAYAINNGYLKAGLPDSSDGSRLSPKLLASYDLTDEVQVYAQWSMAYRAPTVNELYLDFVNTGYAVVGNPELEAETSNSFEIGSKVEFTDFVARFAAYHSRYKNFIEQTTTFGDPTYGMLTQYNNLKHVDISGFEFSLRKDFENGLFVHAGGAYAYGKDKDADKYLRSVAPFKGVVGVGFEQDSWGTDLSLIAAAGMRDDGLASTFDAPGYGVVDLTAWWEPEQTKGLRIQAGIYNMLDKTYYNAVSMKDFNATTVPGTGNTNQPIEYYSEPGRTFKISLTQKF